MKPSGLKRIEFCNYVSVILITLLALIAPRMTTSSVFASPGSKTLEPQTTAQKSKQPDIRELKQGGSQAEQPMITQQPKPAEVRELTLGIPVEQELKGGEFHTYRVKLEAGQYLKVVVEQKGIDVVVMLFGPDGKQVTEVDSPNGTQGPEPVSLIAEVAGEYRLHVKSLEEKAAAGRYEIKVEELRESTARDRDRMAAEGAFAEAVQLRAQGTAESLRKAIEKYSQALPFLRTLADQKGEAFTLEKIGSIYWQLSENQRALDYYSQSLPLMRAIRDRSGEALIMYGIGTVYWQMGDSQKALEYYNQALPLWREAGHRSGEAQTLNVIGVAYRNLGKLREALDHYNQSLALLREIGDRQDEATTLNNIGTTYSDLGELQKSLEYQNQALLLMRATGNRRGEAITLGNIGATYQNLGDLQKALEYQNQTLILQRAMGHRVGEFISLTNIGTVYLTTEPQKALEYFKQALPIARAIGERRGEAATLHQMGVVYRALHDPEKALDSLNQALLIRRAIGDQVGEAVTLSQIGMTYSSMGKLEQGLSYLQQALSLHRSVGARGNEVGTLQQIAVAERERGRLNEARAQIEAALRIIESTRSQFVSQQLRTSFSASRQDNYQFYVDLLMRMHRSEPSAGYDAAALQASERARARSLLDILTESRADIRQGIDSVLVDRERLLQQQLNFKSERLTRLLGSKHSEEQEKAARKEVEDLLTDYQDAQAEIRVKSPRYAALTQPQPLSLKGIQELLDNETLLLEYLLGEERSYLWVVSPNAIKSFELPKRSEIEAAAQRFHKLITDNANRNVAIQVEAASVLSNLVLSQVAGQLGQKRLVIVSDGALQYVPFSALAIPGTPLSGPATPGKTNHRLAARRYQPLITKHEIVQLPSASVLGVLRREMRTRTPSEKMVAVMADPVFQNTDPRVNRTRSAGESPAAESRASVGQSYLESDLKRSAEESGLNDLRRLPFTRREAQGIVALAPKGRSLMAVDFGANRTTVTEDKLAEFRIIHFATHVLLNNAHPELSGIVLSLVNEDGQPQNGFLRLHEIYNLRLSADLVVLSACQTALGKDVKGEGLISLTRGFMYAGGPRVVVTFWEINDEATAEFMQKFYEAVFRKGMRPAAALRTAQLKMWQSRWWQAPYYWAGFQLQGEFR
ncbi:MAG TPA: CHAT domain-containing tetratricopeptide repeat protein [Pyrinomonadaceae bacterium]|nr:CHAT domain-containing tetratricopeptide repeat protein [Pyrinomonadaceae bacterium]